jgi:hypothetical protein
MVLPLVSERPPVRLLIFLYGLAFAISVTVFGIASIYLYGLSLRLLEVLALIVVLCALGTALVFPINELVWRHGIRKVIKRR